MSESHFICVCDGKSSWKMQFIQRPKNQIILNYNQFNWIKSDPRGLYIIFVKISGKHLATMASFSEETIFMFWGILDNNMKCVSYLCEGILEKCPKMCLKTTPKRSMYYQRLKSCCEGLCWKLFPTKLFILELASQEALKLRSQFEKWSKFLQQKTFSYWSNKV